jgi:hypothetical protein
MRFATRYLAPAALAASVATGLPAQQAGGTISGMLGYEDAAWTIMQQDGLTTSGWRETVDGYALRIVGFPDRRGASDMRGALVVEFTAAGAPGEVQVTQPRVTYHGTDGAATWSGSGTNVNLQLEAFNLSGDDVVVAASLDAAMVPGGAQDQIIDAEDKLTFDGNLQATIGRAGILAD